MQITMQTKCASAICINILCTLAWFSLNCVHTALTVFALIEAHAPIEAPPANLKFLLNRSPPCVQLQATIKVEKSLHAQSQ